MGAALSRVGPSLPTRRSSLYGDDDEAELLDDVAAAGGNGPGGGGGFLVPTFRTPLPHTYGRDLGVAIRVADGARAPEFAHDLSAGATLYFFRHLDERGAASDAHLAYGPARFDTGVSFVLPAYLTAYIHGPMVQPKFLSSDDRAPVWLDSIGAPVRATNTYADACRAFVAGQTVLAHIVFLPIVRPDFLLDDAENDGASSPPASSASALPPGAVVPAAEIVIADG